MPQSLYTSQTPSLTNENDGAPGYNLGTGMLFTEAGQVTHLRFFATTSVGGTYEVGFYETTGHDDGTPAGTLLASKVLAAPPTPGAWNEVALDTPVIITPNTVLYRPVLRTSQGRYVASSGQFSSAGITNGSIQAYQSGTNPLGVGTMRNGSLNVAGGSLSYPGLGAPGQAGYYVDVVFVPDSEGGDPVDIDGSLTAPAAGLSGSLTLTDRVSGALAAPVATLTSSLTIAPGVSGALSAPAAGLSALLQSDGVPPAPAASSGGWSAYAGMLSAARQDWSDQRNATPAACPNDGEPLQDVNGILHCPYDGWQWRR